MTFVKICGVRTLETAAAAIETGADYVGFIFYRPSHRYVQPARVGEIVARCRATYGLDWGAVGVFVNEAVEQVNTIVDQAGLDFVQLCGQETSAMARSISRPVIRVVHVDRNGDPTARLDAGALGAERILLDTAIPGTYGGTGTTYEWSRLGPAARDAFLAGGLSASNVGAAIKTAEPWAVDVSSGVERVGLKDSALIREFIREVRDVDERICRRPS